jgi:hypothetical protein
MSANRGGTGILYGVSLGCLFALVSMLVLVFSGPSRFSDIGTSPARLSGAYIIGGAVGGALFDWLAPLAERWLLGPALVGFCVSLPVTVGIALGMSEVEGGLGARLFGAVFASTFLGAGLGQLFLSRHGGR